MTKRAVLLLTFANPQDDLNTKEEYDLIRNACKNEKAQELVEAVLPSFDTTTSTVFEDLRKYRDRLSIFHFAGHGKTNALVWVIHPPTTIAIGAQSSTS